MTVTRFPHGVFATPNLGGANVRGFPGLWTKQLIFVDGTNGADDQDGFSTDTAKKTLGAALTIAGRDDTIYIRPQAVGVRYTEHAVAAVTTKQGLSIIGTGIGRGNSVYQSCSFRGVLAVDSPVLTLNSSYTNVENLHFWSRAAQTITGFGILMRWNTPVGLALNIGSSIINCSFTADVDDAPAAGGATQNAIRMDSTEGQLVEGCLFQNCRSAMSIGSTQSASYSINIRGNQFMGLASNIAADIYMTDVVNVNIHENTFGHGVPSHAAGTLIKYVYCAGTVSGGMTNNTQGAAAVVAATNNTLSGIICSGNKGLGGPWTS